MIRSNAMQMTTHIDARMNQRGIRKDLVELTLDLGEIEGDRYVLTSKMIDAELEGVRRRMKVLTEARKKGGVVVVAEGEALITTYRANSFNAKLSKNNQALTMI
jgi:2-phospho-L-lactate guanylyltransferase (CobY/MobA/RfbA family)